MASAFEAGLKLETPVMIETRASFHMQYLDRLDELAADPTIARPAQAIKLRAEEAQWLTEITRGMTVSFGCRRTECRFFGCNDQWVCVDLCHFRCPCCGEFYFPWSTGKWTSRKNWIEFLPWQKVIQIVDLETGDTFAFPAVWPDEAEDTWLLQQAEIYAAKCETTEDLESYMSSSVTDLHKLLDKVGIPLGMRKFEWNSWVEDKLAGCPKDDTADGVKGWSRLTNGFYGNILEEPADGKYNVLTNWDEVIAILGRVIFAQRQLRSKM